MDKLEENRENLRLMLAEERPPIDARRLVLVGLTGALVSMGLYYFYNMLTEDARDKIKEQVTGLVKSGIQKIALE